MVSGRPNVGACNNPQCVCRNCLVGPSTKLTTYVCFLVQTYTSERNAPFTIQHLVMCGSGLVARHERC